MHVPCHPRGKPEIDRSPARDGDNTTCHGAVWFTLTPVSRYAAAVLPGDVGVVEPALPAVRGEFESAMRVSEIVIADLPGACQLQARVTSDRDPALAESFPPFTLWHRFPAWCRPYLRPDNGDPFLAALFFAAMYAGEPLILPAPVSPRLLQALPEIAAIYAAFEPRATPVPVTAATRAETDAAGSAAAAGLFFSLGVDSFYSLLKHAGRRTGEADTITHLIALHGIDAAHTGWDEAFPTTMRANLTRVVKEHGKTLIPVVTNVRRETARLAPWTMLHGGALVSVALALGGLLRQVTIAASATYATLAPWGTHPLLDPLWSTETLTVVHDGCERDTVDKTYAIANDPLVLETLRVCPGYSDAYNCGRCLKCLRTAIDLMHAGTLHRCHTLPHELDLARLRDVLTMSSGPVHDAAFRKRLAAIATHGGPPGLRAVLAEHLGYELRSRES